MFFLVSPSHFLNVLRVRARTEASESKEGDEDHEHGDGFKENVVEGVFGCTGCASQVILEERENAGVDLVPVKDDKEVQNNDEREHRGRSGKERKIDEKEGTAIMQDLKCAKCRNAYLPFV